MAKGVGAWFAGIFRAWWRHKWSLAISVVVTLAALGIYYVTFLGERPVPTFEFVKRLELDTLDARFQIRGRIQPDPRLIIVDIDQQSQEALGHWPFPRIYFAKLVDALREDGARVVTFDITFSQADATAAPLRDLSASLAEQKKKGLAANAAVQ